MTSRQFQNSLRIMHSLDEVSDVIGDELAAQFHRNPMEVAMRMDASTWASVYALIEKRNV